MRSLFEKELVSLHTMVIELGSLCETGIASAIKGLIEYDEQQIENAVKLEEEVDKLQRAIEQACYSLLLRQQPVARDLRTISACVQIATDMERIGDQAADIAEIASMQAVCPEDMDSLIPDMARACIAMVSGCIDSFVRQDTTLAKQIIQDDDVVDEFFNRAKHQFAEKINETPGHVESYIDLLMVSKYLERIADHAVNIAEWVIYIETAAWK